MKEYFIDRPMTANMERALRLIVMSGLSGDDVWLAVRQHGPAGYNVIEGLLRRRMLDYFAGNRGQTLRATDAGAQWVKENELGTV